MRKHWGMRIVSALLVAVMLCSNVNLSVLASDEITSKNEFTNTNNIEVDEELEEEASQSIVESNDEIIEVVESDLESENENEGVVDFILDDAEETPEETDCESVEDRLLGSSYNAGAAVNYARNNVYSQANSPCGTFVSNCLIYGGGLTGFNHTGYAQMDGLANCGFVCNELQYSGGGTTVPSGGVNAGKVDAGDVIVYRCFNGCTNNGQVVTHMHVGLVTSISNGYVEIAHTAAGGDNYRIMNAAYYIDQGGHGYGNGQLKLECWHYTGSSNIPSEENGSIMATGYDRCVPDGYYQICSAINDNYELDVDGTNSFVDAPNVQLWKNRDEKQDIFYLTYENGFYEIKHSLSGKCLDVYGASKANKTNVQAYADNNSIAQRWAIKTNGRYWNIEAKCSGYRLDAYGGEVFEDRTTNVCVHEHNNTNAQNWILIPYASSINKSIENGNYHIVSRNTEDKMGMNVAVSSGDFRNVNIINNPVDAAQVFNVVYENSSNSYIVNLKNSRHYLEVEDAGRKQNVGVATGDANGNPDGAWKKWVLKSVGSGYYGIVSMKTGEGVVSSASSGGNVTVAPNNLSRIEQHWKFLRAVDSVSISKSAASVDLGEELKLISTVSPTSAANKDVIWISKDESIASVNELGIVTPNKAGTTKITVKTVDGGYTATCDVTVVESLPVIRFKEQDGTDFASPIANRPVVYGQKYPELPIPEERAGFLFVGWFTQPEMKGKQILEDTIFTGDEVLYAGWVNEEVDSFTVLPISDQVYSGSAIVPRPQIYHRDRLLVLNQDYSLKYNNNTNASATEKFAEVVITGKGSFAKTEAVKFTILPKPLGTGNAFSDDFSVTIADKQYNGKAQISKPAIKFGKITLNEDRDYILSYEGDMVNPGTVKVIITGKEGSNYTGSAQITYKIFEEGMSLTKAVLSIPAEENLTYTGSQVKPVVNVKVSAGDNSFLDRNFYDVSYVNNTNVGKATATVKGKNGYSGAKSITFTIKAKPVSAENMTISAATSTYTGTAVKPDITVIDKSAGLVDSTNYTVTYKNNTNAAEETATNPKTGKSIAPEVTVKFKGNYSGSISKPFTIKPTSLTGEDLAITFSDIKDTGRSVINAQSLKPTIKYGKKTLSKGKDYEIEFERASDKEIQTATVKLISNYTGSIPCKFRIYTEKNDFSKGDYAVGLVTDNITYTGRKISPEVRVTTTIDGGTFTLVPGKDYTISYSNNTKAANSTDKVAPTWKVTGKGAYKGTLTGGFTIKPATFSDAKFRVTVANVKFNGKDQKPKVTVVECASGKALKSSDYTAVYDSTKNAATEDAKVTITGRGNYEGTLTGHFRVYGKDISGVTVEKIKNVSYTGKQITPNGSDVKVYADKKKTIPLQEGVHYTLTYGTNLKVGAGSVILNGLGEYGGVKTVKFTIVPKWLQWAL